MLKKTLKIFALMSAIIVPSLVANETQARPRNVSNWLAGRTSSGAVRSNPARNWVRGHYSNGERFRGETGRSVAQTHWLKGRLSPVSGSRPYGTGRSNSLLTATPRRPLLLRLSRSLARPSR